MVYVDTSVIVALLTAEPGTSKVTEWYTAQNESPTCSDWLLTEFSSAVSVKVRTKQMSEAAAKSVRQEFSLLAAGGLRVVTVSRAAFVHAAKMTEAHQHGLRAGDALHLAVAIELGATEMATLDTRLAKNAKRLGLALSLILT